MYTTDKYKSKVRTFGALGYDAERIVDLLNLHGEERIELIVRLSMPGDELRVAYENGFAVGEYNIDVGLTKLAEQGNIDAIETLGERSKQRKTRDMKKNLFGV